MNVLEHSVSLDSLRKMAAFLGDFSADVRCKIPIQGPRENSMYYYGDFSTAREIFVPTSVIALISLLL